MKKQFFCIDGHTCGNPVRLVAGGGPDLKGESMAEKRMDFIKHYDWIRQGLMYEPRGHDQMSGSFLYPSKHPACEMGIVFMETSGCLPMCGHGTIGTVTMALEEGLIQPQQEGRFNLEAPAGIVAVEYEREGAKVKSVSLTNVASFLAAQDLSIYCDAIGAELRFDVAYGGNYYAIFDPQEAFSGIQDFTASDLIRYSQELRPKINAKYPGLFVHPEDANIHSVTHLMWTGSTIHKDSTARNAVFYGDKAIDRSPCGTGTSARLAQWAAKAKIKEGELFIHESFIGSQFRAEIKGSAKVGDFEAIIPKIQGWAKQYGYNTISIDPEDDPFAYGFQVI